MARTRGGLERTANGVPANLNGHYIQESEIQSDGPQQNYGYTATEIPESNIARRAENSSVNDAERDPVMTEKPRSAAASERKTEQKGAGFNRMTKTSEECGEEQSHDEGKCSSESPESSDTESNATKERKTEKFSEEQKDRKLENLDGKSEETNCEPEPEFSFEDQKEKDENLPGSSTTPKIEELPATGCENIHAEISMEHSNENIKAEIHSDTEQANGKKSQRTVAKVSMKMTLSRRKMNLRMEKQRAKLKLGKHPFSLNKSSYSHISFR